MQPGARDRVVQESGLLRHVSHSAASKTLCKLSPQNKKSMQINGHSQSNGSRYLPSARLNVNATKGKAKKQPINVLEMIGSSEDITRRLHEQLDGPKTLFSEDGPVCLQLLRRLSLAPD